MAAIRAAVYFSASAFMLRWTVHYILREAPANASPAEQMKDEVQKYAGAAASAASCWLFLLEGSSEALEVISGFSSRAHRY